MPRTETNQTDTAQPHATGPSLQTAAAVFTMSLIAAVVGTALYGTPEQSERAFRLLHWWKRDPEPEPSVD